MAQPVVALFGYESSTFTIKIRHVLRLKRINYTFVPVPTMMPRPTLRDHFHLTYRKIPVLAIGRELYCDTSIICEALEHFFPHSEGYQSLYPTAQDGRNYRPLIRGFASYWTDRPLFRVTCGLMPASIWRSDFGVDRAQLIGHKLDPDKLEKKLPENLSKLDTQLSLLEPLLAETDGPWIFSTPSPSLADVSVYYELLWGSEIASGRMTSHITQGGHGDEALEGATPVFNAQRYPALFSWYRRMQLYFDALPSVEDQTTPLERVLEQMKKAPALGQKSLLLPTPRSTHAELDERTGLKIGSLVSVVPDDTGRDDPTIGTLVAISPEEVVIKPQALESPATVETRVHFPKVGFVVRPVPESKL
ncbi:glutathione s-transferase like [Lecanosticta acicola]|uniref:Glutathione s-transferase like n=1 Tax=Lecanosticta acicola TaxID=111012 RepID=A0AAI8Z4X2_9PEZI|nr:glutathione s-transferase like [Lecanosticta acicola]